MDEQIKHEILQELNYYGEFRTAHGYPRYEVSSGGWVRAKCSNNGMGKRPNIYVQGRHCFYLYCAKRKCKELVSLDELVAATFPPSNPAKTYVYNSEGKLILS